MDRESVIRKIKKCLALSRSANESEATAALRQAQALMREHNLDAQGVAIASVVEADVRARFTPVLLWELRLVGIVGDAFGCEVISTHKTASRPGCMFKRVRYWRLIGIDAAPEVAGYAYEVLAAQCVRDRLAHIRKQSKNCKPATKTARGDAFALGWVRAVEPLVERFAGTQRDREAIAGYMQKTYPNLVSANVKRRDVGRNVKDCGRLGNQAGKGAVLNHGVGGLQERQLIGA